MDIEASQKKMEKCQCVEICHEKMDEKRNVDKEREKEREKEKDNVKERDRDKERRRNKHKESRKAERREGREKEENMHRRATGDEVRIDKKEDEAKRKDHEGRIMDRGNAAGIVQAPLSCLEENLMVKEDKPGKSVKSVLAHTRGAAAEPGSKGRSRDEKYPGAQPQPRGVRDSKGGGEKAEERAEKVCLPSGHPEPGHGLAESHRERESWADPYISPSLRRPKYSYRAKGEEEAKHHHDKHCCPSPESLTEPSCRMAHIMHSNISNLDLKVSQSKHHSTDKPPRPEAREPSRRRAESQQSPNVYLYMSELVPHPFESKPGQALAPADGRPPSEHSKRKARRSAKEDNAAGNCAPLRLAEPGAGGVREERPAKPGKARCESPGDTAAEPGSKGRIRSREDKYPSGQTQARGERDSKGGGEKAEERAEKVSLPGGHPEPGLSQSCRTSSAECDNWGNPYIRPSSQRPKYSYRPNMEQGEATGWELDKYSCSHYMPAEPNLQAPQKMEYTVISNIASPEVRRKHIKHKTLSRERVKAQATGREQGDIPAALTPDPELAGSTCEFAAEQIVRAGTSPPEYPLRRPARVSRERSSAAVGDTWSRAQSPGTAGSRADTFGQGGLAAGELKALDGWGKGFALKSQFEAKQERFAETKDGLSCAAEKKESAQGSRPPNSRRPRYSYGTNLSLEDGSMLTKSPAQLFQLPLEPVLRITNKSEYMVSSNNTSPETSRKLVRYTSSLEEQAATLSNFIHKAKQPEVASTMQPVSACGPAPVPGSLGTASPAKDNPQAPHNGLEHGGSAFLVKQPGPGSPLDSGSPQSQHRPHGECQRDVLGQPRLHDLLDGEQDQECKERTGALLKPATCTSATSLRQRTAGSLGMTLTDGTLCVDIPRHIVSAARKSLLGCNTYSPVTVASKVRPTSGHFMHHQEYHRRSLQTRKRYQEEVNAALMIQAAWKGYQARAQIRKQAEAAVKIQAAYRGYQIRKFLTEGISENEMDELIDLQDGDWLNSDYPEIFLEEISHSDFSDSEADSREDWLESPVSMIMGSPGSYGTESLVQEDSPLDLCCPNPLLQYENVYQSQACNWGGI